MPTYRCPKCGRVVELPKGNYYCRVCGPSAIMEEVEAAPKFEFIWVERATQYRLSRPVVVEKVVTELT